MPRPRVAPENRIRAYRACDPCKASKTRCDSQLPCTACTKARPPRTAVCSYGGTSSPSASSRRPARERVRQEIPSQAQIEPGQDLASDDPESPQEHLVTGPNGETREYLVRYHIIVDESPEDEQQKHESLAAYSVLTHAREKNCLITSRVSPCPQTPSDATKCSIYRRERVTLVLGLPPA